MSYDSCEHVFVLLDILHSSAVNQMSIDAVVRKLELARGADIMDGMNRIDRMPQNNIQILSII